MVESNIQDLRQIKKERDIRLMEGVLRVPASTESFPPRRRHRLDDPNSSRHLRIVSEFARALGGDSELTGDQNKPLIEFMY